MGLFDVIKESIASIGVPDVNKIQDQVSEAWRAFEMRRGSDDRTMPVKIDEHQLLAELRTSSGCRKFENLIQELQQITAKMDLPPDSQAVPGKLHRIAAKLKAPSYFWTISEVREAAEVLASAAAAAKMCSAGQPVNWLGRWSRSGKAAQISQSFSDIKEAFAMAAAAHAVGR